MLQQILDLHIHSKYSRACSPDLELPKIAAACAARGIDMVATGDFTHPAWFKHLQENLVEVNQGIYRLADREMGNGKRETGNGNKTRFIIGTEISSIKKHAGETRRVHHLIFAPSLAAAEKFNRALSDRGINISADGRPIIGMTSHDLLSLMLETDPRMVMIPAHAWTPWFGIFGSNGGYDSLAECFADLTPHIFAIETGLSSDPPMNWRWSALDHITLISNSDAHSTAKLGREANVLQFASPNKITYDEIMRIIREGDREKFLYTIEFYPEEGKYHLDGHRDCQFVCPPAATKKYKGICPKCRKPLVIGVMNRVEELADRSEVEGRISGKERVAYRNLVPLSEIIAATLQVGVNTKTARAEYDNLVGKLGSEFHILLRARLEDIARTSSPVLAEAIDRARQGKIHIQPGYDGVFGVVKVFGEEESRGLPRQTGLTFE